MPITTADNKKRVVIPTARPGDVFEIRQQSGERVVLVRQARTKTSAEPSRGLARNRFSALVPQDELV